MARSQANADLIAPNSLVEGCNELDSEDIVVLLSGDAMVPEFVVDFDELEPVDAKACRRLNAPRASTLIGGGVAAAHGKIPAWTQHLLEFPVSNRFAECWNHRVGHDESLPFALRTGMAMCPVDIKADGACRQPPAQADHDEPCVERT